MYKINTFRDLVVWQKAMDFVVMVYRITKSFPVDEKFGLVTQLRRCAISVPSNIAEGYGRNQTNDYIRFLQISMSSLYEMQTQIEISFNLEYIDKEKYDNIIERTREIERMLSSLIKKIKK